MNPIAEISTTAEPVACDYRLYASTITSHMLDVSTQLYCSAYAASDWTKFTPDNHVIRVDATPELLNRFGEQSQYYDSSSRSFVIGIFSTAFVAVDGTLSSTVTVNEWPGVIQLRSHDGGSAYFRFVSAKILPNRAAVCANYERLRN